MYQVYEVESNDTLESILNRFQISEKELRELNGFFQIIPGFDLVVPRAQYYDTYLVQKGDTLYQIARKYGTTVEVLEKLNGKEEGDYLYENEMISVPKENVNYYFTKEGDTLLDVASNFNRTVEDIIRQNERILLEPDQMMISKKRDQ